MMLRLPNTATTSDKQVPLKHLREYLIIDKARRPTLGPPRPRPAVADNVKTQFPVGGLVGPIRLRDRGLPTRGWSSPAQSAGSTLDRTIYRRLVRQPFIFPSPPTFIGPPGMLSISCSMIEIDCLILLNAHHVTTQTHPRSPQTGTLNDHRLGPVVVPVVRVTQVRLILAKVPLHPAGPRDRPGQLTTPRPRHDGSPLPIPSVRSRKIRLRLFSKPLDVTHGRWATPRG